MVTPIGPLVVTFAHYAHLRFDMLKLVPFLQINPNRRLSLTVDPVDGDRHVVDT